METLSKRMLIIPEKCVAVDDDEMEGLEGGVKLPMDRKYLNRNVCSEVANIYTTRAGWNKVTATQLKKEIYGHALVFYRASILGEIPGVNQAVYSHVANGIDIENKVDRFQAVWNILWNV